MHAKIDYELKLITDLKLRVLLPHGARHRERGAPAEHPLPGPRLGREFGGVLLPRRHRGRSRRARAAVGALHLARAQRAAGHRHRFRARAARRGHPVRLPQYGRDRAALTATVISYRPRSALRDVGKVSGSIAAGRSALGRHAMVRRARSTRSACAKRASIPATRGACMLLDLARQLLGFPRHLSQHVGGFVISQGPLDELVPVENAAMEDRTVIQWDKDDLDALGLLKVDVLGLGMLSALRRGLELVSAFPPQALRARRHPERRPARLRHDLARRHHRRVPDRIARADVDAAAAASRASSTTSSSRSPSCARAPSRAAWCIPICAGGRASSRSPIRAKR